MRDRSEEVLVVISAVAGILSFVFMVAVWSGVIPSRMTSLTYHPWGITDFNILPILVFTALVSTVTLLYALKVGVDTDWDQLIEDLKDAVFNFILRIENVISRLGR